MRVAGIISIGTMNTNGSFTCIVRLDQIDRDSDASNFRKTAKAHINEIVINFKPHSVRNPILRWRRNKMISLDGRHGIHAMSIVNESGPFKGKYTTISADVFFKISDSIAASIFYDMNMYSKRMDTWSAMHAARLAKYDFAVDILEAVAEYDLTTPIDDGIPPRRKADLTNVDPLMKSWTMGRLDSFLKLLHMFVINGELDPAAKLQRFQLGLLDILARYDDMSVDQLCEWIGRRSASFYKDIANDKANNQDARLDKKHYREAFESTFPRMVRMAA
jgi:hypothetical protein